MPKHSSTLKPTSPIAAIIILALVASCSNPKPQPQAEMAYDAHDAAMRELKGQVKVCRVTEFDITDIINDSIPDTPDNDYTISFTPTGMIATDEYYIYRYNPDGSLNSARSVDFPDTHGRISRDANGRITQITNHNQISPAGDWQRTIVWDNDSNIAAVTTQYTDWSDAYSHQRDSTGLILATHYRFFKGDNTATQETSYQYLNSDSVGNWTERIATTIHTETGNPAEFRNGTRTFRTLERRRISYYDFAP